jgi:hypothetical protein
MLSRSRRKRLPQRGVAQLPPAQIGVMLLKSCAIPPASYRASRCAWRSRSQPPQFLLALAALRHVQHEADDVPVAVRRNRPGPSPVPAHHAIGA